jgi:hypothetical protein
LKKRTQFFWHKSYKLLLLDARYRILPRVSSGAFLNAQCIIFLRSVSARANTSAPPYICIRAGPKHPKITLPYSNVETARAYTNYILTRLLKSPNKREWHLILWNAALVLQIRFSNIAVGLLLALFIISPKYWNSSTFLRGNPLHVKTVSILIYITFVFPTLIFRPFTLQNCSNAFIICYRPSALWDNKTASSAKARKNTCKVAISKIYLMFDAILCSSKYFNKYGYT